MAVQRPSDVTTVPVTEADNGKQCSPVAGAGDEQPLGGPVVAARKFVGDAGAGPDAVAVATDTHPLANIASTIEVARTLRAV
jgi:hypothetical protein